MKRLGLYVLVCFMSVLAATAGSAAASLNAQSAPTAQSALVRDCHHWAYWPNVLISSARNMTCRRAKRLMRQYRAPIYRTFTIPAGFYCYRVSGGSLGGQWRCVKGSRAFRFDFGD